MIAVTQIAGALSAEVDSVQLSSTQQTVQASNFA